MPTLPTDLRNKLERTCIAARNLAERAAKDALEALAVHNHEPYGHMTPTQRSLRNKLRARARQLGDKQDPKGQLSIFHLAQECAYEHWHRMLFARFLAENQLLIEPEMAVAISLDEVKELAKEAKVNPWALAGRYAQAMLPEIFRDDDPVLQISLAREDQLKLEELLDDLAKETFTAGDSLGWCYQFWQSQRKEDVNRSGNKVGADELPCVTQLFTEDYMVDFLLDNTLGAWWAGKELTKEGAKDTALNTEDELRRYCALPNAPWKYLRFVKEEDGKWSPAAGTFSGWPKTAKELKCLDPCCGSGHFLVAMFERLVAMRMAEEKLNEKKAVIAVVQDNLFGLEIDPRCTQIAAFSLALAAWRRVEYCALPAMHIACSGLAPNAKEADWLRLAGDKENLQRGMARLYRLFQNAPALGSLINPRAGGDLLDAGFQEVQPLLEKALETEKTTASFREGSEDYTHLEISVAACGIARAAEILASQFTLVATNVPYLGRGKQESALKDYCNSVFPSAKSDLATCFVERCLEFCDKNCSTAFVSTQYWLFLTTYKTMREKLLASFQWDFVAKLGSRAFETISGEVVNVALLIFTQKVPASTHDFMGFDVSSAPRPPEKAIKLGIAAVAEIRQKMQLKNPNSKVVLQLLTDAPPLEALAIVSEGLHTGDYPRFGRNYWEIPRIADGWSPQQGGVTTKSFYSGMEHVLFWEGGRGDLVNFVRERLGTEVVSQWIKGEQVWGQVGVSIGMMGDMNPSIYQGALFTHGICAIVPKLEANLPAVRAFCESADFCLEVRKLDQKICAARDSVAKVPFDLTHWQKVAAEKYPHGLPKPFSSDPTQWLFSGHPKGSDNPFHVAVGRLLGYRWPRQTGSSFSDCPVLGQDGLEKLADDDGIVCVPAVRGEAPAAERLRKLLSIAYGSDWKSTSEQELIHASGSEAGDLEEWLRNDFFEQHCDTFHQRPFVWHIWDGRRRDGFHALVNYHKLANGDQGRRTLESLTHSYLGDWITRQKDSMKRGEEGADERLAAALALKEILEAIIEGEPPFDIFVRWKPLTHQAIGWQPDINDGVRMNIRPFMVKDIPSGKRGSGVLRAKPNIRWDKDRGKEPMRDRADFPWFWNGEGFTGDRVNDGHLTKKQKEEARKKT